MRRRITNEQTLMGYLFVLPVGIAFVLFTFYPLFYAFQLSLTDWNGYSPVREFVGAENYVEIFTDDRNFRNALSNTVYYTLGHVPLTMAAGLALALLVNGYVRGRSFFRTVYFLPHVTPHVAAAIVFIYILNGDWGVLNWFLAQIGLPTPNWLGDPDWAMPSVILYSVWKGMGYHMLIYLAGLQSIPNELNEAGEIDGAGRWQGFRYITWPLLTPTTFFLLTLSLISSFKVFTSVFVMTEGGPAGATSVLVYRIYQHAFQFFEMGYASAMSYVLFAIVLVLTLLQFRYGRRHVHYGD
ncbi:sugar ABC transporter permease [Chloroflexi bacterium TSY]|nr:sugar ABC transporter permease [Chloroflexi bacterium TSY]